MDLPSVPSYSEECSYRYFHLFHLYVLMNKSFPLFWYEKQKGNIFK